MADDFGYLSALDEDALWTDLHRFAAQALGITSILFGFTHSIHFRCRVGFTRSLFLKSSHPQDYMDAIGTDRFLDDDLCALVLADSIQPFLWSQHSNWTEATHAQKQRAKVDEAYGMGIGVSIGFRFANGHGLAGIGLCAKHMEASRFEALWERQKETVLAYLGAFQPNMRLQMVRARIKLPPRPGQVLALSVAGMRDKEIAAFMKISKKTVENYKDIARRSLMADTTMEAVAKALAYNLI